MDVLERVKRLLVSLLLLPLFPVFGVVPAGGGGEPPEGGDGDGGDGDGDGNEESGGDGDGGDGKRYTQAEVDAIIQKRLGREKKKNQGKDQELEELRTAAARLKELEDAEKTEVEKLRDEVGQLKGQLEDEEGSLTVRQAELKERIVRLEVRKVALELGFIDPDDAYLLADLSEVALDENTDEVTGVEKALKALVKGKPHLVKGEEDEEPPASGKGTPPRGGKRKKGKTKIPTPKIRL